MPDTFTRCLKLGFTVGASLPTAEPKFEMDVKTAGASVSFTSDTHKVSHPL